MGKKSKAGKGKIAVVSSSIGFVPRPLLPPRQTVNMAYQTTTTITESAVSLGAFYTFKVNDLFDPDFTGTGTQPVGYDQFSNIYGRFRVLHCKLELEMMTTTGPIQGGGYPSVQSTLPAATASWPSQPYGVAALMQPGMPTFVSKHALSMPELFKVRTSEYMDEIEYSQLSTASPLRVAYFHVWIRGFNVSAAVGTAHISVRMLYTVEASAPLALNVS